MINLLQQAYIPVTPPVASDVKPDAYMAITVAQNSVDLAANVRVALRAPTTAAFVGEVLYNNPSVLFTNAPAVLVFDTASDTASFVARVLYDSTAADVSMEGFKISFSYPDYLTDVPTCYIRGGRETHWPSESTVSLVPLTIDSGYPGMYTAYIADSASRSYFDDFASSTNVTPDKQISLVCTGFTLRTQDFDAADPGAVSLLLQSNARVSNANTAVSRRSMIPTAPAVLQPFTDPVATALWLFKVIGMGDAPEIKLCNAIKTEFVNMLPGSSLSDITKCDISGVIENSVEDPNDLYYILSFRPAVAAKVLSLRAVRSFGEVEGFDGIAITALAAFTVNSITTNGYYSLSESAIAISEYTCLNSEGDYYPCSTGFPPANNCGMPTYGASQ